MASEDPLVNNPTHYREGRMFEPFNVLMDWFPNDPLLWQACKYLSRCGRKGGPEEAIRDVQKAIWYLERKQEQLHLQQLRSAEAQNRTKK